MQGIKRCSVTMPRWSKWIDLCKSSTDFVFLILFHRPIEIAAMSAICLESLEAYRQIWAQCVFIEILEDTFYSTFLFFLLTARSGSSMMLLLCVTSVIEQCRSIQHIVFNTRKKHQTNHVSGFDINPIMGYRWKRIFLHTFEHLGRKCGPINKLC